MNSKKLAILLLLGIFLWAILITYFNLKPFIAKLPSLFSPDMWSAVWLLVFVIFIQIMTYFIHYADQPEEGFGIKGRYTRLKDNIKSKTTAAGLHSKTVADETPRLPYRHDDTGAVGGLLTKQSIFVAVGAVFILHFYDFVLPNGGNSNSISPSKLYAVLGFVGLLLAILLALASIYCYSTFLRFNWGVNERISLLRKGDKLDQGSFYCLSISLLLGVGYIHPLLSYWGFVILSFLMVYYYFFTFPNPLQTKLLRKWFRGADIPPLK